MNNKLSKIFLIFLVILVNSSSLNGQISQSGLPLGFFPVRSQSPVQQLRFSIQHHPPWTLHKSDHAIQIQYTWKNIWLHHGGLFRVDGETHEWVLRAGFGLTERLELMVETPVRYFSGGILDGLIESFHDLWGLGQAARDQYPRNQFVVEFIFPDQMDGASKVSSSEVGWHLGNLVTSISYDMIGNPKNNLQVVLTGNLKLPTSTKTALFGSQGVDFASSLGLGYSLAPMHIYTNGGLIYFSDSKILGVDLHQLHKSMLIAFEYHPQNSNHSWVIQGLVESGVAKGYSQFSKRTSELLVGYKHRYRSGVILEFGFLENLFYFDNSPDIAFHAALTKIY